MVKKLVLQVDTDPPDATGAKPQDFQNLLLLNNTLLEIVTAYKDKITEYYVNRSWDRYKKLSNEYEHIFYSPNAPSNIALYNPVSRSFFKLWEILHDFEGVIGCSEPKPMRCVFLAEGPGGFFEAFYKRRKELKLDSIDSYFGITLRSSNKNVPDWKTHDSLPIKISYGCDGSGNLYNIDNILHFVQQVGPSSVDFITADGGFDFSSDFNNQEEQSFRLIASEVLACLLLQKEGGTFLLKLYDCFNTETLLLLEVLKRVYRRIYFIKPLTSRPANSERYILCEGYTPYRDPEATNNIVDAMTKLVRDYEAISGNKAASMGTIPLSYDLVYYTVLFNMYYTIRQVFYIQRTINYINFFKKQEDSAMTTIMNSIMEKHTAKSKRWCVKYNIPYKE